MATFKKGDAVVTCTGRHGKIASEARGTALRWRVNLDDGSNRGFGDEEIVHEHLVGSALQDPGPLERHMLHRGRDVVIKATEANLRGVFGPEPTADDVAKRVVEGQQRSVKMLVDNAGLKHDTSPVVIPFESRKSKGEARKPWFVPMDTVTTVLARLEDNEHKTLCDLNLSREDDVIECRYYGFEYSCNIEDDDVAAACLTVLKWVTEDEWRRQFENHLVTEGSPATVFESLSDADKAALHDGATRHTWRRYRVDGVGLKVHEVSGIEIRTRRDGDHQRCFWASPHGDCALRTPRSDLLKVETHERTMHLGAVVLNAHRHVEGMRDEMARKFFVDGVVKGKWS